MAPAPAPKQEVEQAVAHAAAPASSIDLSALADAVAQHETGYCTSPGSPTANARNNCWGIMAWPNGKRTLRTFNTKEEAKQAFIALWQKGYGGRLPTWKDAEVYTGGDKTADWYNNVHKFYAAKVAK